jgi:hypothetical protein
MTMQNNINITGLWLYFQLLIFNLSAKKMLENLKVQNEIN